MKAGGLKLTIGALTRSADSEDSDDWGPGFEDLDEGQKKMLKEIQTPSGRLEYMKALEDKQKDHKKAVKLMNTNMLQKWNVQLNHLQGDGVQSQLAKQDGGKDEQLAQNKTMLLPNF